MSSSSHSWLRLPWRASAVPGNSFGSAALVLSLLALVTAARPAIAPLGLTCGVLAVFFGFLACVRISRGITSNHAVTLLGVLLGFGATVLGVWSVSSRPPASYQAGTEARSFDRDMGRAWFDGTYLVGTQVPVGTYISAGAVGGPVPYCRWERLSAPAGAVLASGTSSPGEPVELTVRAGDWALRLSGCQPFHRTGPNHSL